MTTERNAQGVDVLAWLDSLHVTDADGAITNRKWPEAQEARAAVAELVGAINEYRDTATAARAALPGRIELTMKAHESATTRLRAALAKFPEPRP